MHDFRLLLLYIMTREWLCNKTRFCYHTNSPFLLCLKGDTGTIPKMFSLWPAFFIFASIKNALNINSINLKKVPYNLKLPAQLSFGRQVRSIFTGFSSIIWAKNSKSTLHTSLSGYYKSYRTIPRETGKKKKIKVSESIRLGSLY